MAKKGEKPLQGFLRRSLFKVPTMQALLGDYTEIFYAKRRDLRGLYKGRPM
jgi:hypothetical protein